MDIAGIIFLFIGLVFNIANSIQAYRSGNNYAFNGWGVASLLSFGWLLSDISNYLN